MDRIEKQLRTTVKEILVTVKFFEVGLNDSLKRYAIAKELVHKYTNKTD